MPFFMPSTSLALATYIWKKRKKIKYFFIGFNCLFFWCIEQDSNIMYLVLPMVKKKKKKKLHIWYMITIPQYNGPAVTSNQNLHGVILPKYFTAK